MSTQDPSKYEPYEPTQAGMKKLADNKESSWEPLIIIITVIVICLGPIGFGMLGDAGDDYRYRAASAASASQSPRQLDPMPPVVMTVKPLPPEQTDKNRSAVTRPAVTHT